VKWTQLFHEPALRELFSVDGQVGKKIRQLEAAVFDAKTPVEDIPALRAEREGILFVMKALEVLSAAEKRDEDRRVAEVDKHRRNHNAETYGISNQL
jgi:hypothetical protein